MPVGLDTVRLSGPIGGTDWATSMADSITETQTVDCVTGEVERWSMWVPGDLPFKIEVSGADATLVFECSLPRRRTGTNLRPLPADEARHEVADLYEYFDHHAGWLCPVPALRVRRLDVTVDFTGVTALPTLLPALASVSAPAERRNPGVFHNRERGGALTLVRGSREYERSLVYDKHVEVTHRHARAGHGGTPRSSWEAAASRDVARFESQARSSYLTRNGVDTVADMTQDTFDRLAKQAWDRHALGTHVADVPTVLTALEHSGLSPTAQSGVLLHLFRERNGLPCAASAGGCAGHRKVIRSLGLAVVADLAGTRPETWLDFEARRQLTRADSN